MISAQDMCSVFNKTLKDGWGFVPGFDGQLLTNDMLEDKISDEATRKAASKWVGKRVADAGGLFAYAFRTLGMADGYTADGTYISKIFKDFCDVTGKLPKGGLLPGMVIFKRRHDTYVSVGLYIGNSSIIECKGPNIGVTISKLSSEWTYWGKLKNVDYNEVPSKATIRRKEIRDMRVMRGDVIIDSISSTVDVHAAKHLGAKVVDSLPLGTKATVVEDCGEFCKIQYTKTGYVQKENLKEALQS